MRRGVLAMCAMAATLFGAAEARAQDAPPVAAPTVDVAVAPLPVVRSQSEQVADYAAGLAEGLMSPGGVRGVLFVAVKEDHVIVAQGYGAGIDAETRLSVQSLPEVLRTIAVMQLVEQGHLSLNDDLSKALGDAAPRGATVGQALLHQGGVEPGILTRAVERVSGEAFPVYAMRHVFAPLKMMRSGYDSDGVTTTAEDVGRLLLALVNGGATGNERVLLPDTLGAMERTRVTPHPAVPGRVYGFAEMHRNGWRALQHDGARPELPTYSRIVVVPDARLAYFLLALGPAKGDFWRRLDNALFDRMLPPRAEQGAATGAAPGATEARAAAGTYVGRASSDAVFLKVPRRPLSVQAREDGALLLSGAEDAILLPHAGGYWQSAGTQIPAVLKDGVLLFGDIAYVPFPVWKRPSLYAWLALFAGFAAVLAIADPVRVRAATRYSEKTVRNLGPGLVTATFLLVLLAVVLQRLAFAA